MSKKNRNKRIVNNILQKSTNTVPVSTASTPQYNSSLPTPIYSGMPMLSEWASVMQNDVNLIKGRSAQLMPNYRMIQERDDLQHKSVLLDPYSAQNGQGYVHKHSVSFNVLRHMSKTHIIRAIIETRKEQISSFCQPQPDKYTQGFVLRKKKEYYSDIELTLTRKDKATIKWLTDFIINCGSEGSVWTNDSFDVFTRKFIDDAMTLDQACYEICYTPEGYPGKFIAVDGATIRLADSIDDASYHANTARIKGYTPSYVQVIDGMIKNEYYPWQLCFGIRNPTTNIYSMGYGHAELEDLITTVTNLLNADHYNGNYFKIGSNPGGIFQYSGSVSPSVINSMKNQWMAETAGVNNMHKTPFIHADQLSYIKTHDSNRDMEYSQYQEFLIKVACALFKIDPSEIGFHLSGNANQKMMFEGNNEARLQYSKDKGLLPLLKQYQFWINKYLITPLAPDFEFAFVGLSENEEMADLDSDIKLLGSFMTLNEIRGKRGLKPVPDGDTILNPNYLTAQANKAQQEALAQAQQAEQAQAGAEPENPVADPYNQYEPEQEDDQNPIKKAFITELPKLFNN